ncbi:MAG: McrC family protein [Helicobacter sp.]|nr:McrC family protein [Helicobacter sp.]
MQNNTLTIAEWQEFDLSYIRRHCVKNAENAFNELCKFASKNPKVLDFSGKDKLKAQNFVGLIQTKSGFYLEILPKIAKSDKIADKCECGEILQADINEKGIEKFVDSILNVESQMYIAECESRLKCGHCKARAVLLNCLSTLRDMWFLKVGDAYLKTAEIPLLEVFINAFLEELSALLVRGLKHDYIVEFKNSNFLRGKLECARNIKENFIHKERFFIASDEFSSNIAANRLIKSTLMRLKRWNLGTKTSVRLNKMRFNFDAINESKNIEADFKAAQIRGYERILAWCELLLKDSGIMNSSGDFGGFSLLFDMNLLFESYVTHYFKKFAKDFKISAQNSEKCLIFSNSKENFRIRPDLIVESKGEKIIIDTKWKNLDSSSYFKNELQKDLYQIYAYAATHKAQKAILVYPLINELKNLKSNDLAQKVWQFKANNVKIIFRLFPLF